MTTKEVSDLTGKAVRNVNRDTENMLSELYGDVLNSEQESCLLKFEGTYKDSYGRDQKCYILPKDLTLTLVSGYNVKMRKAIIDRWIQLEEKQFELGKALQCTAPIVLRKMADLAEERQEAIDKSKLLETNLETAKSKIENLEPMAEYGRGVFTSENLYTVTNAGQIIGLSGARMNYHLKRLNVIRKGTGKYTDFELCMRYANQGLVRYREQPGMNSKGENVTYRSLRWTRKGYDWLIENGSLITDVTRKSLPLPKNEPMKRGA